MVREVLLHVVPAEEILQLLLGAEGAEVGHKQGGAGCILRGAGRGPNRTAKHGAGSGQLGVGKHGGGDGRRVRHIHVHMWMYL